MEPPVTAPPPAAANGATAVRSKADLTKRFIAAVIDGVLVGVASLIPFVGGLVGAAYMLVRDGLDVEFMDRRSIGKKVMKLRPIRLDGRPMDIEASVKRNWMFALGAITGLLLYIPIIGWLLIPVVGLVALVIGIIEIVKVLTDDAGRRLGDNMAGTQVVEVAE